MPISELFPLRFSEGGKRASSRGSSRRARMRRAEAKREAAHKTGIIHIMK
ncbi:hypothetical protein [Klebsiella pneumoniae IS43]|uniref:Uncharacterized protein n=1 Tax=Klebsiella pneumoniae IS43 TaxID=1432552 RepID=W1DWD3_KLEPN|nr:hypothetical protein [Klebsiella pneumoniae IS43]